jgi:4'-phosphopantetheinyl transferase
VSHSGGIVVYAFTRSREVGIDVEHIRPMGDMLDVARRNFSIGEFAALTGLPEKDRLMAFYLCWTRKEAFIKAIGEGISFPLQQFDVSLIPGEPAQLQAVFGSQEIAQRWSMHDLKIAPGYAAALVIEDSDCTLIQRTWGYTKNFR